jgi:hypothetical protein
MRGWGLVVAVLAAVALGALVLKELPPSFLLLVGVAGSGYGAFRYSQWKKADQETVESRALGFEAASGDPFGLLALPLQLLVRGGETGAVRNVMWGTWHGLDVKLFDFSYRSEDQERPDRRMSCALAAFDVECKPVVIEPGTFFTPPAERGSLPHVDLGLGAFGETFVIRTRNRAFARSLLGEEMREFLEGQEADVAFEVSGRMLLAYAPSPVRDSLDLVQAIAGFERLVPRKPPRAARRSGQSVSGRQKATGPTAPPEPSA